MNTSQPVFDLQSISKAFGKKAVYSNMSLRVKDGETLTIIGGSGEGKSVCLRMMIGLLYPDRGDVLFKGQSVLDMSSEQLRDLRTRVAMVFQGGALFDSMTVFENVSFALREHTDMSEEQMHARSEECLTMVGLDASIMDHMPASLSGGMKKRVALARSIAIKPEVILYDEPTTGLDPSNSNRIGEMIMKLQKELGVTSVVVTHDMTVAFGVSDRIAVLLKKQFPHVGTPDEIRSIEAPEVRDFIEGRTYENGA